MKVFTVCAALSGLAAALPQDGSLSTSTVALSTSTTISVVADVPKATSVVDAAAVNVTIPVEVSDEILNSVPLTADNSALTALDPIESNDFLSIADLIPTDLSMDDIPEVSVVEKRDLSFLFSHQVARGPLVNFLKIAAKIFINAKKRIVFWEMKKFECAPKNTFPGWANYKSNGVNLGGWLVLEKNIQPDFFRDNAPDAIDEDSFCGILGQEACGKLLEDRYKTYFTEKDIDNFASYGINTLRIPIGYWAYMPAIAGDNFRQGGQLAAMNKLAHYAIEKHNMHIIVDLHGMPGGQNGLDNQGKTGQLTWWHNETAFDLTIDMVKLATASILAQPNSGSFTLSLINEPLPALYFFGQTQDSIDYLNKYYKAALAEVRKMSKTLPVALSDGFIGPQTWNPYWTNVDEHLVFDTHIYFFVGGSYSYDAAYGACYLAKSYVNSTTPTFIGEWSIQATEFNHLGDNTRKDFFRSQLQAYSEYLQGGMFWNGKHDGDTVVGDDGSAQKYYWSWEILAQEGIVPKAGEKLESLC